MANDLSPLIPKLLAQGLLALRQAAIMPRLVNRGYEAQAGDIGSAITIPVSSAVPAQAVTPAATPPATSDMTITSTTLTLDKWYEAPFYMTDKDLLEVDRGVIPMQASEAVKSLANQADADIFGLAKDIYGYVGTPGVTPLATDASVYLAARKTLTNQLCPMDPRYMVMNADMEANALGLRAFQDASFTGNIDGIINGQINNKLGARWLVDQNIPSFTTGAAASYLVNNAAGLAVGAKTAAIDGGTGAWVAGDIVTFAGHAQTYVIVSSVGGATATSITFEPGLVATVADNAAITKAASRSENLLFHRDAFAFASRPFSGSDPMNLGQFMSMVDPVSGLTLRLEVSREHKRTRWSFDILYGVKTVRREFAVRIAG
jgi:hypothetical protein